MSPGQNPADTSADPSSDLPALVAPPSRSASEASAVPPLSSSPPSPPSSSPGDGSVAVMPRSWGLLLGAIAVVALLMAALLWQRLGGIQEHLARQNQESGAQASEARAVARQAQDLAQETAAKLAVSEARLSEVTLQRTQLEELMQSLSRSRDENLVVDIESAVRLAQQQAQLTGSVQPLLAALTTADQRVVRAAQPRLTPVQRAIARDLARIKATALSDTPGLLIKMDEMVRLMDDLPLANVVATTQAMTSASKDATEAMPSWWRRGLQVVGEEARNLLRVSRIENPEAALLSPEQSFFVRENVKLKLLNARLGLLARQLDASRADIAAASLALNRYFDVGSRKTQTANTLLLQVQTQMKTLELPRVDDTLAALSTAAAGR